MEANQVPINRQMDKKVVVHIYTLEYYSAMEKDGILALVTKWMNIEDIMLSKVSQRKTNTTCLHLYVASKIQNK